MSFLQHHLHPHLQHHLHPHLQHHERTTLIQRIASAA
jgi:hypothetical protein